MKKSRALTCVFLILLMVSSILLPTSTKSNAESCDHPSYTDYYYKTEYDSTCSCHRRHWYNRKCNKCGEILDQVAGSWNYYHNYGPKQYIGEDIYSSEGKKRRRDKYAETCKNCGNVKYSYGPWGPWE